MSKRKRQEVVKEVIEDMSSCSTSSSDEEERALYEKLRKVGLKAAKAAIKKSAQQ